MECMICSRTIQPDENVFWLSRMVCCGPGDYAYKVVTASDQIIEVIHTSCLGNAVEAKETPSITICDVKEENCIVQRSNALSLFDL